MSQNLEVASSASTELSANLQQLIDQLPVWRNSIDQIALHVIAKREEFAAEYKKALKQIRPKRRTSRSVISLRSNDVQTRSSSAQSRHHNDESNMTSAILRPNEISPLEPATKYLLANARRTRRKPLSSVHSQASASISNRSQHQLIIYYDSNIQDGFGTLVKDIGGARNLLRKRQHVKTLEQELWLPSLRSAGFGKAHGGPMSSSQRSATNLDLSEKSFSWVRDGRPSNNTDTCLSEATAELEAAQSLCETAAHQFLRYGDCVAEIDRIKTHFDNALRVAQLQVAFLRQEEYNAKIDDPSDEKSATKQHAMASIFAGKIEVTEIPPATTASNETAELEVDSDDGSGADEMVVSMSHFRTARSCGLRA